MCVFYFFSKNKPEDNTFNINIIKHVEICIFFVKKFVFFCLVPLWESKKKKKIEKRIIINVNKLKYSELINAACLRVELQWRK